MGGKMSEEERSSPQRRDRLEDRWGERVLAYGFTSIPNVVYRHQAELGLKSEALTLFCQVMTF